jgi:hypothetical protein
MGTELAAASPLGERINAALDELAQKEGGRAMKSGERGNEEEFDIIGENINAIGVNYIVQAREDGNVIHEATEAPVAVVLAEENLLTVAQALSRRYPRAKFVMVADLANQATALAAAKIVSAGFAAPKFQPFYHRKDFEIGFADLKIAHGIGYVRESLEQPDDSQLRDDDGEVAPHQAAVDKIRARVAELAVLDEINYQIIRKAEAKKLGITVSYLDSQVKERRKINEKAAVPAVTSEMIEPSWPSPVDGGELVREVTETIRIHVAMEPEQSLTVALWAIYSHVFEEWPYTPYLLISSPLSSCGKSTLTDVLECLVARPEKASARITPAALYNLIDQVKPTLLLDEAHSRLSAGDIAEIVDAGYNRGRPIRLVVRKGGESEVVSYEIFCPKVFALIGRLPGPTQSRCIVIRMRLRRLDEQIQKLNKNSAAHLGVLHRKITRWAADNADKLRYIDHEHLEGLTDRSMDNWRPLFAVAELCGEELAVAAQRAALAIEPTLEDLAAAEVLHQGEHIRLLNDLREVLELPNLRSKDELSFEGDLLPGLCGLPETEWNRKAQGRPLTARACAMLLSGVHVAPQNGGPRGKNRIYRREDLEAAFSRYLPESSANSAPPAFQAFNGGPAELAESAEA